MLTATIQSDVDRGGLPSMHAKPGRPPKPGERFPSGDIKPKGEPTGSISATAWQRIKAEGMRFGLDARLGSEIGRLSLHGELTNAQTVTAFRIGEIYGRFERYKRRRRSVASPSYESGFGDADVAEERMDPDELARHEVRIQDAERQFHLLQEELPAYPPAVKAAIEDLCVNDRMINPTQLAEVCYWLDRLTVAFRRDWARRQPRKGASPRRGQRISAKASNARPASPPRSAKEMALADREAFRREKKARE